MLVWESFHNRKPNIKSSTLQIKIEVLSPCEAHVKMTKKKPILQPDQKIIHCGEGNKAWGEDFSSGAQHIQAQGRSLTGILKKSTKDQVIIQTITPWKICCNIFKWQPELEGGRGGSAIA